MFVIACDNYSTISEGLSLIKFNSGEYLTFGFAKIDILSEDVQLIT